MAEYVGTDVSLEEVWLCVMDEAGDIVSEGKVVSDLDAIGDWLLAHAPQAIKIGIETGAMSSWLWHALKARDLPVICVDARHAKRVLSLQLNKNDRNDAAVSPPAGAFGLVQGGARQRSGQPSDPCDPSQSRLAGGAKA